MVCPAGRVDCPMSSPRDSEEVQEQGGEGREEEEEEEEEQEKEEEDGGGDVEFSDQLRIMKIYQRSLIAEHEKIEEERKKFQREMEENPSTVELFDEDEYWNDEDSMNPKIRNKTDHKQQSPIELDALNDSIQAHKDTITGNINKFKSRLRQLDDRAKELAASYKRLHPELEGLNAEQVELVRLQQDINDKTDKIRTRSVELSNLSQLIQSIEEGNLMIQRLIERKKYMELDLLRRLNAHHDATVNQLKVVNKIVSKELNLHKLVSQDIISTPKVASVTTAIMETHSTTTSGQRNTVVGEGQEEGDSRTNRSNVTINSKSVNRNSKLLQRLKLKDAMKNLSRFEDLAGQLDAVSIQKEDMVSEMTDSIKSGLRVLFKIEEETANYHNRLKDYRESVFYVYRGIRDDPEECLLREFSQLCKYSENIARVRRTIEERDCNFRGVNMNRVRRSFR